MSPSIYILSKAFSCEIIRKQSVIIRTIMNTINTVVMPTVHHVRVQKRNTFIKLVCVFDEHIIELLPC